MTFSCVIHTEASQTKILARKLVNPVRIGFWYYSSSTVANIILLFFYRQRRPSSRQFFSTYGCIIVVDFVLYYTEGRFDLLLYNTWEIYGWPLYYTAESKIAPLYFTANIVSFTEGFLIFSCIIKQKKAITFSYIIHTAETFYMPLYCTAEQFISALY